MSPRAWGCTETLRLYEEGCKECPHVRGGVPCREQGFEDSCRNVPTCVGVYQVTGIKSPALSQCPHVRGGVPRTEGTRARAQQMSPRAWGCTEDQQARGQTLANVPTCVGVYRRTTAGKTEGVKCPHVRGGVPPLAHKRSYNPAMSPRAWGCTGVVMCRKILLWNVPTCVGVYRNETRDA